ncbi:hypothetical protein EIP86_005475 [Pleurotus ostreatoroseus]|nr:hypothetical protein EIP86_005475 [Pleurotus ostreatoroseus]
MHPRGRSHDISPLAVTVSADDRYDGHAMSLAIDLVPRRPHNLTVDKRPHTRACHPSRPIHYTHTLQPVASSSRTDPSPPFSHSHASTASTSPEPTPAPATPPELAELDYPNPTAHTHTLKDQLHAAYAADDLHTARVLLLRLRGVAVSPASIAAVSDADFDAAFVPRGKFKLDPEVERRCQEGERREREMRRRREREERLWRREKVWEEGVRCVREERRRVKERKEEAGRVRRREGIEAREREREAREREQRREQHVRCPRTGRGRAVLSYDTLPAAPSRSPPASPPKPQTIHEGPLFEYAIMPAPVPFSSSSSSSPSTSTRPHSYPTSTSTSPQPHRPSHSRSSSYSSSYSASHSDTHARPHTPESPNRALRELTLSAHAHTPHVPFAAVVRAVLGPLFPPTADEERALSHYAHARTSKEKDRDGRGRRERERREARRAELLDALLDVDADADAWAAAADERGTTRAGSGSGTRVHAPRRAAAPQPPSPAPDDGTANANSEAAGKTEPASAQTASTVLSRSLSWFSFGSRSSGAASGSVSTAPTSPSTSPSSSNLGRDVKPGLTDCLAPVDEARHPVPILARSRTDTSKHTHTHVYAIPVSENEHPLSPPAPSHTLTLSKTEPATTHARGRPLTRRTAAIPPTPLPLLLPLNDADGLIARLARPLAALLDAAAGFQRAYVRAAVSVAGPEGCGADSGMSRSRSRSRTVTPGRDRNGARGLRPEGYRASCADVCVFVSVPLSPDPTAADPERAHIALESPPASPIGSSSSKPALPLAPRIPPPRALPRSPFRLPAPPAHLTARLRPVANPLLLRLRVLQNAWGNVDGAREIREKVVGVAWEGRGRSGLSRGAVGVGG